MSNSFPRARESRKKLVQWNTPVPHRAVFALFHTQEVSVVLCRPHDISLRCACVPTLAPSTHKRRESGCPGSSARGYSRRSSHFTSFWFGKGHWKIQPCPHPSNVCSQLVSLGRPRVSQEAVGLWSLSPLGPSTLYLGV